MQPHVPKKKRTWGRDKKKFVGHLRKLGVLTHLEAGHVYDRFTLANRDIWAHDWDELYGLSETEIRRRIAKWLGRSKTRHTNGRRAAHYDREQDLYMKQHHLGKYAHKKRK